MEFQIQKVLFGAVFWTLLGAGLLGLGTFGAIKFAEGTRAIAVVVAIIGVLILVGTFGHVLRLFDPCYAWFKA